MYLAVCYGVVLAQKPTEVRNRSQPTNEGDTGGWNPEHLEGLLQPSQNLKLACILDPRPRPCPPWHAPGRLLFSRRPPVPVF